MNYITVSQAAQKWDLGIRQVQNYCRSGIVEGVTRFNGVWAIPEGAVRPDFGRGGKKDQDSCDGGESFHDLSEELTVFRQIVDQFPYRINITDANGFMVYANEAFFEGTLSGVRKNSLGRYNILQEELLSKWGLTEHIRKAFRGERVQTTGLRFPNRDFIGSKYGGEYAFFSLYNDVNTFPIFGPDGGLRYVVTTFIPVREYVARDEVMRAKEYIETHWNETFRTEQAARAANLAVTSFVKLFRNETGMTPHEYYIQIKITRLRDLLLTSSLSISQAFDACGMDYNSYYTSLFKRHAGMTPKQFREQSK
jgi:AraC-like DNA-binding protein